VVAPAESSSHERAIRRRVDLGTTNSAVAFVDTPAPSPAIEMFLPAQLVAPGSSSRADAAVVLYLPADAEFKPSSWRCRGR
jgi:hypothetical protein